MARSAKFERFNYKPGVNGAADSRLSGGEWGALGRLQFTDQLQRGCVRVSSHELTQPLCG